MANPFKIFRKNQKRMVVILTVLAMGGFVVLPIVMKTMGTGGSRTNKVVVSTKKYGNLRESDLHGLIQDRQAVLGFLEQVGRAVVMAGGRGQTVQAIQRGFGSISEEAVVDTWLLANQANDLGLVVSDDAINDFLDDLLENQDASVNITEILQRINLSDVRLFDLLRRELLALRLQDIFGISMAAVTPAERWDYYQRLNRKIAVEAITIPVRQFVGQIADPDEDTLLEFFEEHKDREQAPGSPDPGFRVPKKIALQYLKGQYDQAIDPASIPAAEVEAYYQENKEQFKRAEFTLGDKEEPRPGRGSVPGLDDGRESLPGLFENRPYATPLEPKTETFEPATEPMPEGLRFPTDLPQEPAPSASPAEKPVENAGETPPHESSEKQETADDPPATQSPDPDDGSSVGRASAFVLASYRQEDAAEAEEADEVEDAEEAVQEVEETEYKPLKEVQEEIRQTLAREKFQKLLGKLQERMITYRNARLRYDVDQQKGTSVEPPEAIDFSALAKENGLTAHQTGLISAQQALQLDIGRSTVGKATPLVETAFKSLSEFRPTTAEDNQGNQYLLWKLEETEGRVPKFDEKGMRAEVLRVWKTTQAREKVRKLAAILADELGKKLAPNQSLTTLPRADLETARKEASSQATAVGLFSHLLEADWPDLQVVQTEPFSWMTYGAYPPYQAFMYGVPPQLSEIKSKTDAPDVDAPDREDAVQMPGDEFMRAVYALEPGDIGAAMNQPMTAAYVVRIAESKPAEAVLWGTFLVDMKIYAAAYGLVAGNETRQVVNAWRDEIKTTAGFKWERPPYRSQTR